MRGPANAVTWRNNLLERTRYRERVTGCSKSGTRRKRELLAVRWTTLYLCRGRSADVAAAPVFPPSILLMLFLTFSLHLLVPLFSTNVELVLFPEPFFSFLSFLVSPSFLLPVFFPI